MTYGITTPENEIIRDIFAEVLGAKCPQETTDETWTPSVNVQETKEEFILYVALPGVKKEDVETEIKDNVLSISGKAAAVPQDAQLTYREIPSGQFRRAFRLGAQINTGATKASLGNGILEIRLAKAEEAKASKIQIA
jgi:HSP20 family protein